VRIPPLIVVVSVALDGDMIAIVSPGCKNCAESESIQQSISDIRQHFFILLAKVANYFGITII
jgi:hypothetical protein